MVEFPGHRKSARIYHVNMLKPNVSRESMVNMVIVNDTSNEESEECVSFPSIFAGKHKDDDRSEPTVNYSSQLTKHEKGELKK